jgi:hypothetical protein
MPNGTHSATTPAYVLAAQKPMLQFNWMPRQGTSSHTDISASLFDMRGAL